MDLIQSMMTQGKNSHCFAFVILNPVFLQCLGCEAPISAYVPSCSSSTTLLGGLNQKILPLVFSGS